MIFNDEFLVKINPKMSFETFIWPAFLIILRTKLVIIKWAR